MNGPDAAEIVARTAWSRLAEPGDLVAGALVAALGAVEALAWLQNGVASLERGGPPDLDGLRDLPPEAVRRLGVAGARWAPRWRALRLGQDLAAIERLGGRVLVPGHPEWPGGLDDLGAAAPHCLWVRGEGDLAAVLAGSVAVIGARACTAYGEHVASEIGAGVVGARRAVVSGGAYGIDAVAHRAALAAGGPTVAVLAGGLDRPYPAGNVRLLAAITDRGGAVISEVPPGSTPTRSRFLQRNRLIAAVSAGAVVVEAAWRSGALNTAGHAAGLLRPVGAVPGPVTSMASAGCHRLLREGSAVCVTDAAEVLELVGRAGCDLVGDRPATPSDVDGLSDTQRRTLDALPSVRGAVVETLCRVAGLTVGEVRAALGALEVAGLAEQDARGWRRRRHHVREHNGHLGTSQAGGMPMTSHTG
ncbi:DNA-processing protein DprA [Actinotalea sp. K2]|uniref:DNA-processing protein DprA n=1 Tax=Actinotalea sp. K2 TaxID=2939438 RepID=UPI002017D66B|nr:DNA-processing protein DprA [Actinotalea sp. K2]MCL3860235.1 DNA-processing protein DprA [Actinotalea sp. K2]